MSDIRVDLDHAIFDLAMTALHTTRKGITRIFQVSGSLARETPPNAGARTGVI